MPTTNQRGHTVPTGTEQPSRAAIFDVFETVNDIPTVANSTDRNALLTAIGSSSTRALMVYRSDLDALEVHDGSGWRIIKSLPSPGVQRGIVSATLTAQSTRQVSVTFPTAYSGTPVIVQGLAKGDTTNTGIVVSMEGASSTGVTFRVSHTAGTAITIGLGVHWVAYPPP